MNIYRLLYQILLGNVNQNKTIDTHTEKKQKPKNDTRWLSNHKKKEQNSKWENTPIKTNVKQTGNRKIYINNYLKNVNGLNAPTKRHRLAEWILKQDPQICCL